MPIELDHVILAVNDNKRSIEFYAKILGLKPEPFALLRVTPTFVIQVMQKGTQGGEHLAFSVTKAEFNQTLDRLKEAGVPYGDNFDRVGNMKAPGRASGSKPNGHSVYFHDPDKHMIEVIHYEAAEANS